MRTPRTTSRTEATVLKLKFRLARHRFPGARAEGIIRISQDTIVKFSSVEGHVTEARTLDFIASNTTIPVPRVKDTFWVGQIAYIAMQFVEGVHLDRAWKTMSSQQRKDVLVQLKGYMEQLRALVPPHPGVTESVDGTRVEDPWLGRMGPFESIAAFEVNLGLAYVRANRLPEDVYDDYEEAIETCYARTLKGEYITKFTHCDLAPRNILVDPKTCRIVSIIDWESGGWYPEYWEYTQAYMCNQMQPEWSEIFRTQVLEPYQAELRARQLTELVLER